MSDPGSLPDGWLALTELAAPVEREARAEISDGHELWGRGLVAVAQCRRCDDVLFQVDDDTWAIVHLTWSGHAEPTPWPSTVRLGGFVAVDLAVTQHKHGDGY
jgi:hypothetical protein